MPAKQRAPRNKTINLTKSELKKYKSQLLTLDSTVEVNQCTDRIIHQDLFEVLDFLPHTFVDLLFIDPPYNLKKAFNENSFREMNTSLYAEWVDSWLSKLIPTLKPNASIYICGDWRSSGAIQQVAEKYFIIRNRITWEREKGRGAKTNWKNNSEDIWFCTLSDNYYFNVDAVKLKRKVLAPYKNESGTPKDWEQTKEGDFRLTYPSNIWTDLTIPFWSMPENTDHPTQKPEKLLAKIILANSRPNEFIFDPFLGSGTTAVVAKKLGRHFLGIECDETYAATAMKRLHLAETEPSIQGFSGGVFWERNAIKEKNAPTDNSEQTLFNNI